MTDVASDSREVLIRRYFDACNRADADAITECFTADAVHYFPPGLPDTPWRSARRIAEGWLWCVAELGSQWTIERMLLATDGAPEAVIEWTHWKTAIGTAQRGDEWYRFDPGTGLISEIRAYYAAPAAQSPEDACLYGFDYASRGYATRPPDQV